MVYLVLVSFVSSLFLSVCHQLCIEFALYVVRYVFSSFARPLVIYLMCLDFFSGLFRFLLLVHSLVVSLVMYIVLYVCMYIVIPFSRSLFMCFFRTLVVARYVGRVSFVRCLGFSLLSPLVRVVVMGVCLYVCSFSV